jgi:hypothetical protein
MKSRLFESAVVVGVLIVADEADIGGAVVVVGQEQVKDM